MKKLSILLLFLFATIYSFAQQQVRASDIRKDWTLSGTPANLLQINLDSFPTFSDVDSIAGGGGGTGNQPAPIPNDSLANSTISGHALGTDLDSLNAGLFLKYSPPSNPTFYNGTQTNTIIVDTSASAASGYYVRRNDSIAGGYYPYSSNPKNYLTGACATCVTSAASLTANSLMIGAGSQGSAVTTTGTGVLTALGTNVGSAGSFVVNGGALGTPSSGTGTNLTGVPLSTGVTGEGSMAFSDSAWWTKFDSTCTNYFPSSTVVGYGSYTTSYLSYRKDESTNLLEVWFNIAGASNATTASFTIPVNAEASGGTVQGTARTINNGGTAIMSWCFIASGSNVVTIANTPASGSVFNNTGTKGTSGYIKIPIQ